MKSVALQAIRKNPKRFGQWFGHWIARDIRRANPDLNLEDGQTRILALTPERFRGDVAVLNTVESIRVWELPKPWQGRIYSWFLRPGEMSLFPQKAEDPEGCRVRRRGLREFLTGAFQTLQVSFQFDFVISAARHYQTDFDWGVVAQQSGQAKYVVIHREGAVWTQHKVDFCRESSHDFEPFQGEHLVVHAPLQAECFIQGGYVKPEQTSALGNLRMDSWVRECREGIGDEEEKGSVLFFSFGPGSLISHSRPPAWPRDPENFLWNFCRETHQSIAQLAVDVPSAEVTVKAKWAGRWLTNVKEIWEEIDFDDEKQDNLRLIGDEGGTPALIRRSQIVVAFNTTAFLEAAIAGKVVICPMFAELREEKWRDYRPFDKDVNAVCEVANTREEFDDLLRRGVEGSLRVTDEMMERRWKLFEQYLSPVDEQGALGRYLKLFQPHKAN